MNKMANFDLPKILIIGATPYRDDDQSRSQITYFKDYPKAYLSQVFSNARPPLKGICSSFFQITDKDIFKNFFPTKRKKIGQYINDSQCKEISSQQDKIPFYKKIKHNWVRHWTRFFLWHTKAWNNKKFKDYILKTDFDIIFFQPSDDYYLFDVLEEVLKIKHVPVVMSMVDDYYFCHNSFRFISFYWNKYISKMNHLANQKDIYPIFITNKMREKYQKLFINNGEVIHVSSSSPLAPCAFNKVINNTIYSGSMGLGRFHSLVLFSKHMQKYNPNFFISIYPTKITTKQKRTLAKYKNVILNQKISYDDLQRKIYEKDSILLIEETRKNSNVDKVMFSLSTKTADSILSGKPLIIFANEETGLYSFFKEINIYPMASNVNEIPAIFEYYKTCNITNDKISNVAEDFNNENTSKKFRLFLEKILKEYSK